MELITIQAELLFDTIERVCYTIGCARNLVKINVLAIGLKQVYFNLS